MNVSITVRDLNYGDKHRTSSGGEKMKTEAGEKGPNSIWEIIY